MKVVEKPWGKEIWFAHTDKYAGKIIEVNKGARLSLQYHREKDETLYVLEGRIKLVEGGDDKHLTERVVEKGEAFANLPYWRHRIEALEDTVLVEVSTPELGDVVRVEDDYGRVGEEVRE